MVETSGPAVRVVVEGPGGGSGQKRAPGSRVWDGAVGSWPESSHTASQTFLSPSLDAGIVQRQAIVFWADD